MAAANFPAGALDPVFDDDRTGAFSAISAITIEPGASATPGIMKRYGELLQDRLQSVPGTKQVEIYGEREEEILVTIDPRKLASVGLSAAQVSAAIGRADAKVRAGQVRGQANDLLIEITGEITSLERIRKVPLVVQSTAASSRWRISPRFHAQSASRPPHLPTRMGFRQSWLPRRCKTTSRSTSGSAEPKGCSLSSKHSCRRVWSTGWCLIRADIRPIGLLTWRPILAIGIALVVAVLLVTLGWRAALIVASILPLASLISLAGLQVLGIPIHQMSITGLIVALGLLVDAGIVMTDEIRKRMEAGVNRIDSVAGSVNRLAIPLLASTITTALAFMPMAMLPGPGRRFCRSHSDGSHRHADRFFCAGDDDHAGSGRVAPGGTVAWSSSRHARCQPIRAQAWCLVQPLT